MYSINIVNEHPLIICVSNGIEQANSYIIIVNNHAILIDVTTSEIADIIIKRGISCDFVLLTHEHADHIWGLNRLRDTHPNVQVIAHTVCSNNLCYSKKNKAKEYRIYAVMKYGIGYFNKEAENRRYCCSPADIVFKDEYAFEWQGLNVFLHWSPGHSEGSVLISIDSIGLFSGDTVLLGQSTFLDFEGGCIKQFFDITKPYIYSQPNDLLVFPGHGGVFRLSEWKNDRQ